MEKLLRLWWSWSSPGRFGLGSCGPKTLSSAAAHLPSQRPALPAASPVQIRNIILRIHGSNTIGSRLAPELAKAFLEGKEANRIEQVSGEKELESFVQGDFNGDAIPEAIEIHAHGSRTGPCEG